MITMIVLVGVFAAVVVPQALTARAARHQEFLDSIQFHAGESARIDGPPPVPSLGRGTRSTIARRRNVFVFLLMAVAVSAVGAVASPGKVSLVLQLAVDNCLIAYVALLVRWRDARAAVAAPAAVPDLVLTAPTARPVLRIG
jgi:hypothetical protein